MIGLLGLAAASGVFAVTVSWCVEDAPSAAAAASATGAGGVPASAQAGGTSPTSEATGDASGEAPVDADPVDADLVDADTSFETEVKISLTSLALAVGGVTIAPMLSLLSVAGLAWLSVPVFRDAYTSLTQERRVRMSVVDAVTLPAAIVTGHLVAAAFGYGVIFVGHSLLQRTKQHSRDDMLNVFEVPDTQVMRVSADGELEQVAVESLIVGDRILLDAGQGVPVDGTVLEGHGRIDQRALTGESQPVERVAGDAVLAATLIVEGRLLVQVDRSGSDTVAAGIHATLRQTVDFKSTVQTKGEAFGDAAALPLLGLSAVAFPLVGPSSALAILFAPLLGTVRLAAPIGMLNHLGQAAVDGILIRDGRALELMADVDMFVFDKTGTLTTNQLRLHCIASSGSMSEDALLVFAASAEQGHSHPIARALLDAAEERGLTLRPADRSRLELGRGLDVDIDGHQVVLGSANFVSEVIDGSIPQHLEAALAPAIEVGASVIYVAIDAQIAGALALRCELRADALRVVEELRARGHQTLILSGDHEAPTRHLAQQLGVDGYFAETLPEDKAGVVRRLQDEGRVVCFIGDGINDAIALKSAQVSVSMSDATQLANETAQIVLTHDRLGQLLVLLAIADSYAGNIRRTAAAAAVPSAACIGGALFGQVGLLGAIGLYTVSLAAGLLNAAWPVQAAASETKRHP